MPETPRTVATAATAGRRTVLDIGANVGDFGIELARRNPDHLVLCVEPVPALARRIVARAAQEGLTNVVVEQVALASAPGDDVVLHVAEQGDWGISSLLELDAGRIAADEYWAGRPDLRYTSEVRVRVERLETVLERHGVGVVDFVKIDVQGLDLDVLASAGARVADLRAGMLEVPTVPDRGVYAGEAQDLGRAHRVLDELGLRVAAVKANDEAMNEVNVYFTAPDVDLAEVERTLGLRGVHMYDGKHFWAVPCANAEEARSAQHLLATAAHLGEQVQGVVAERDRLREGRAVLLDEMRTVVAALRRELETALRTARAERARADAAESDHALLVEQQVSLQRQRLDVDRGREEALAAYGRLEQQAEEMLALAQRMRTERDTAVAERDRAVAERDAAVAERDAAVAVRDAAVVEPVPAATAVPAPRRRATTRSAGTVPA
ncbi:FkbM family methyltransferase [Cellulomonas marina]|uniref:Methyltransferase, FkbM family n=1 Tax=Cellulomonas marina TaxID=988821 RepID=A0A1I0WJI8_9CELL|nr:FkbM family methyltransferase [Cellulomonas marina]GIG27668.1 hypothetical protein Cma02nite_02680 [Cellulomonas marina]SFA88300.1 methyltransferase, FkbM family [Cellulomonas marina]